MEIEYLGHAAVLVRSHGYDLLVDPYESGQFDGRMAYRPIEARPHAVVCSHAHVDHCATHAVPGSPQTVTGGTVGPFEIRRFTFDHDEYGGRRRGGTVDAIEIRNESHRVIHLSDVGQAPETDRIEPLQAPDLLLVPVGGFYTIGAAQAWEWLVRLNPRITVPIHYRTPACSLPIRGVENFLSWVETFSVRDSCQLSIQGNSRGVIVLPPKHA